MRQRPDLNREAIITTRENMDRRFPKSLRNDYETIIENLQLPDPNDRHVLALAILTETPNIVTLNLKDFPSIVLHHYGIEAIAPDEFIFRLSRSLPYGIVRAAKKHRQSLRRPPKTVDEYLLTLEKQRLPKTVAFLREHRNEI